MVQENSLKSPVIVICGPTGSGKSALAIELCKVLNGEIISSDSIAIYKDLDIGAAKPTKEDREKVSHYMIDIVEPTAEFSVAEYALNARKVIDRIILEGKVPIVCGGTGYYIDALLYDFSYGNCPKDDAFRLKCDEILKNEGSERLHAMLKEVDEKTAEILHPNDSVRVVRALEIFHATGIKKSEIVDEKTPVYPFLAFSYDYPRDQLYSRINSRVDKMFENGLMDEVKGLLESGVDKNCQSMQGIGYKEVVEGIILDYSVDEIKEKVKLNTRHYAKRQITWFKRLDGIRYLSPKSVCESAQFIKEIFDEYKRN